MRIDHLNLFRSCFATKVAQAILNLAHFSPLRAFDEDLHGTVREFEHLQDASDAAHFIEVLNRGFVFRCGFLCHQQDALAGFHRSLKGFNGFGATHK